MVERLANSHERSPKGKLLVAPGFGESGDGVLRYFGRALAGLGYDPIMHEHAPIGKKKELKEKLEAAKVKARELNGGRVDEERFEAILESIPLSLFREAEAFIRLAEEHINSNRPLNAVGHSQGGLYLVVAAVLRPDLFKKLVLINPAGFTRGPESGLRAKAIESSEHVKEDRDRKAEKTFGGNYRRTLALMTRYVKALRSEINAKREIKKTALKDYFKYSWSRGIHALREGFDMANTDIVPYLEILQHNFGVDIAIIYDDSDDIFPKDTFVGHIPEGVESLETEGEGHFGPPKKPKEFARHVDQLLQSKREEMAA